MSITATKAVMPHVDAWEGVDWQGVEDTLTSPAWQLADGRAISDLFGEGWREIQRTVREQVRKWRRFDEELIGPEATLRLLTMGGSTSYTRHWWGQGRWPAICKGRVDGDGEEAGCVCGRSIDLASVTATVTLCCASLSADARGIAMNSRRRPPVLGRAGGRDIPPAFFPGRSRSWRLAALISDAVAGVARPKSPEGPVVYAV